MAKYFHRVFVVAEIAMEVPMDSERPTQDEVWRATSEQLDRFAVAMHGAGSCIHVRREEDSRGSSLPG